MAGGALLLSGCSEGSGPGPSENVEPRSTLADTTAARKPTGRGLTRATKAKADARDFKARVLEKR